MLQRLAEITARTADLAEAKSRLVARDTERLGVRLGVYLLSGCLGVLGIVALLGAGVIVLADAIGTPGALAIAGVTAAVLGVGIVAVTRWATGRTGRPSRAELAREAAESSHRLTRPTDDGADPGAPAPGIASDIASAIAAHPGTAAGAAFAAMAVFGPRRVLRVVAEAAAAADVAASLSNQLLRDLQSERVCSDEHHADAEARGSGAREPVNGRAVPRDTPSAGHR